MLYYTVFTTHSLLSVELSKSRKKWSPPFTVHFKLSQEVTSFKSASSFRLFSLVLNGHFVTANYTNTLELNKRITKQTDGTFHNSQRYIKCLWLIRIIWDLSKVKFNLFQPLEPKLIGQSIKRSLALAGDVGRSSDLSIWFRRIGKLSDFKRGSMSVRTQSPDLCLHHPSPKLLQIHCDRVTKHTLDKIYKLYWITTVSNVAKENGSFECLTSQGKFFEIFHNSIYVRKFTHIDLLMKRPSEKIINW